MTQSEFLMHCVSHSIYPGIALENTDLVEALENRDDVEVIRILEEEF